MAYTRGWNDSTPAGTRAANQIDDAIREKCVDIHERMDSTFAVDWLADPVVAKPALLGTVVGRLMVFGPHIFVSNEDQDDIGHIHAYVGQGTDSAAMYASPYLPNGITIQKLELVGDRNGNTNIVVQLSAVAYLTGAVTVIDTATRAVAGLGLTAGAGGAALAHLVDTSVNHYVLRLTSTNFFEARLYAVRLTVDVPNNLSVV